MYKYLQEDTGQTQLKKVKCQRACKFCRKSHTTCEDTRPCQRCIKRDIAQLCLQDEADQLQQQAAQQAQQQMAAAAAGGGSANGSRSTIPAKRRGFSHSSYEEDQRGAPPPPVPLGNSDGNGPDAQFLPNGGAPSAAQAPNSTPSLRTPSPVRNTDMMNTVPLPNILTSPQDAFRPLQTFPEDPSLSSGAGPPGGRVWYDQSFQHALEKMDGSGVQAAQPGPQPPRSGATPEGFSWSALVEGMLDTSPHTPGDFAWLSNSAPDAAANGSAQGLSMQAPPPQQQHRLSNAGMNPPNGVSVNASTSPTASHRDFRPEASLSPSHSVGVTADQTVQPFNYTFSYSRLRTFANDLGNPEFKARVAAATDRFKPILHGCLSQYTDDQIVQSEVQFLNYVRQWAVFCDTIPAPACVWRRTGEIYAANTRFMRLIDVQPDVIRKGRLTHYQILDPASFLDYWESYASQVLNNLADRTSFDTHVSVAFAKRNDPTRTHLLSSSMHFDSFGLPMAATVVFTPLFPTPGANGSGGNSASATTPNAPSSSSTAGTRPEPTIEVQVGGDARNPIVRPVALSSLAALWMV